MLVAAENDADDASTFVANGFGGSGVATERTLELSRVYLQ